jgi:CubicO group peptidase (beta-lactamase class C family)
MKKNILNPVLLLLFLLSCSMEAQEIKKVSPELKQMTAEFDRLLSEQFKPGETGCAALVAKNGQIIYKKAFGMANLELNVPMQPEMVFRIGSITKQFTAVSILQLMEQGKLSLQDDIKKFIPDYPTQAYNITIEHLLTHTSGIKSYTNVPEFQKYVKEDKTPQEAIDMFKNLPMEFEPGTKWNYNNSGFFLLGYIIEKITGKTYAEYVEDNIFKPAGMTNSCYGSDTKLIKNRAYPYRPDGSGAANADYLSMKLPYSAGSLMSTVEDLYKWNRALLSGKLVKRESLDKAFTEYKLTSGKGTGYGYGWFIRELQGSRTIEHGGGINGYLTNSIYLPAEDVYVAVFSNNEGKSPDMVSTKMAAVAIGKPWNYKEIPIDKNLLQSFPGIYQDADKNERTIILQDDKLFSQRPGTPMLRIIPFEKDSFYLDDRFTIISFNRDASGKVISCVTDDRGMKTSWIKTSKAVPVHTEIRLSPEILSRYAGDYELAPGFILTVTTEGDRLFTQATGQEKVEAFAESETKFFLKIVDANFEFVKDDSGKFKFVLHQGGMTMEGKKVR